MIRSINMLLALSLIHIQHLSAKEWTNWSHLYQTTIDYFFIPETKKDLITLTKKAYESGKRMKVLGSGHSLSPIALPEKDTWVISLENYRDILEIDEKNLTITVQAGATIQQIIEALHEKKLALENLSSITAQTISGMVQTGTHGTGLSYSPLHTNIQSMTVINGKGEWKKISAETNPHLFKAWQCGLGALGIVETLTLKVVPQRLLDEKTYPSSWPHVLDELDELTKQNEYFRFYWFPYTNDVGVWTANSSSDQDLERLPGPLYPVYGRDPSEVDKILFAASEKFQDPSIKTLEDLLEKGPFDEEIVRLYHKALYNADYAKTYERTDFTHRILSMDCGTHANCCAIELAIPTKYTKPYLLELQQAIEEDHFPSHTGVEVRFVKSDQAYLSMSHSDHPDDTFCFLSIVSMRPNGKTIDYDTYFKKAHKLAEKYHARSHWGKMGIFEPEKLKELYPNFELFKEVQMKEDPRGIFLNEMTRKIFERSHEPI